MNFRRVHPEDSRKIVRLMKEVEKTSPYMMMEGGERKTTPEQFKSFLERIGNTSTILAAEESGEFVGYVMILTESTRKTSHRAYMVIGIREDWRGKGLGKSLIWEGIQWAKERSLTRLELTVVTDNKPAIALYKRMGFVIEGTKRQSLYIDGQYHDEYYMAQLLEA
ncbi:RimJ/RimL family protein N-acetyltransferase [Rossellomorea marisflavi]